MSEELDKHKGKAPSHPVESSSLERDEWDSLKYKMLPESHLARIHWIC